MLKTRLLVATLALAALLAGLAAQARAEWKDTYIATGNNVGLSVQNSRWAGPLGGGDLWYEKPTYHQFPRGSGNIFKSTKWNWGVMTVRDMDGDGSVEDTLRHGGRGCNIGGTNVSLESYKEVAAAHAEGEPNMQNAMKRIDHNRVLTSTDPEDLADWYPEFREGRKKSGEPILHGAETICVRFGDAVNNDWSFGVSMEYRFHFLNFAESNNMVYGHVFIRNMSEYLKWSSDPQVVEKVSHFPDGQVWEEWTFHLALTEGVYIGDFDEAWNFYNPKGIYVISDLDGVESFAGNVFMVGQMMLRLPSHNGETMVPTNVVHHSWETEFGFSTVRDILAGGTSNSVAYRASLGKNAESIFPGATSPWNGKPLFGWPGLLDPEDERYDKWLWGSGKSTYSNYMFWGALHNFSPRDSTSADFVIMFVEDEDPVLAYPVPEISEIDNLDVQENLAPVLDYAKVAEIVFESGFVLPETPVAPPLTIIPGDRQVTITWSDVNASTADAYYYFLQEHPELDPGGLYVEYDFEGYRLYRSYVGPSDSHSELIWESSKSGGDIAYHFIDKYGDDNLRRMANGMKVWYALVPYDLNYDPATGEAFSLPDPASGKTWNRPGPGDLYNVIPRSEASNFRAAGLEGTVTYRSGAGGDPVNLESVEISGDGTGKLTQAPLFLAPDVSISMEPVINEKIISPVTAYLQCTGGRHTGGDFPDVRRNFQLVEEGSRGLEVTEVAFRVPLGTDEQSITFYPPADDDGVKYAVLATFSRMTQGDFRENLYMDLHLGGYTGGAANVDSYRSGDSWPGGTAPSVPSLSRSGVIEAVWTASGNDLTLTVTDVTRGRVLSHTPYMEDEGWGFVTTEGFGSAWEGRGTYYDEIGQAERTILMLDKLSAENTAEFGIYINGLLWTIKGEDGVISMPAVGTKFTFTHAYGSWNSDKTVFTQWPDPPFPGDSWEIKIKPMSLDPEDVDLSKILVVPNPYLASSFLDLSPDSRRLEFINLPDRCTIRIYSIGGHLVNVLNHIGSNRHGWGNYTDWDRLDASSRPREFSGYDNHGGTEAWNLRNRFGQTVASGLYFYHVTDVRGKTHTGKFYVVN